MKFKKEIIDKTLDAANVLIEQGGTLRSLAEATGINRQSLSNYFRKVLPHIDADLSKKVNAIIEENNKSKSRRGGLARKKKREEGTEWKEEETGNE